MEERRWSWSGEDDGLVWSYAGEVPPYVSLSVLENSRRSEGPTYTSYLLEYVLSQAIIDESQKEWGPTDSTAYICVCVNNKMASPTDWISMSKSLDEMSEEIGMLIIEMKRKTKMQRGHAWSMGLPNKEWYGSAPDSRSITKSKE